jgi:hypothetical protein
MAVLISWHYFLTLFQRAALATRFAASGAPGKDRQFIF